MTIEARLEAMLFVADSPMTADLLADAAGVSIDEAAEGLRRLGASLEQSGGLQLIRIAGGYQLCTKPEHAEAVARMSKPHRNRLSRSQVEVLAVVAYRQPVTAAEIDSIRGVSSEYGLRQLLDKHLVREVGRKQAPGRPVLFGTTRQFLHHFNLNDLAELPDVSLEPEDAAASGHPHAVVPATLLSEEPVLN